ncbi:MAG: DUF2520 domain-containing protein [Fidelibacterota bacterium]
MKFALLGASKTGTSIAYHLWKQENQPVFLWNRSKPHLMRTLRYVPFEQSTIDMSHYTRDCELIIISVADNAIEPVAKSFFQHQKDQHQTKIIHTSGALDSSILSCWENTGSLHPVISISSIEEGLQQLPHTTFTCEGKIAEDLVKIATSIGKKGLILTGQQKQYIHLSAVFMNNYLSGMVEKIKIMNSEAGISKPETADILEQISLQTLTRSWSENLTETLTGPIKRGDTETIKKHLDILANDDLFQQLYKNFGNILVKFVNHDRETGKQLEDLLKK